MRDSKSNSGPRIEGKQKAGARQDGSDSLQAGQAERRGTATPKKGRSSRQGNKRATDGTPTGQKV